MSPAMVRAAELARQLSSAQCAADRERAYRLFRTTLFSALAPKRDGTHPIFNAPLELEVI